MRLETMAKAAELLRERKHDVTWVIDKAKMDGPLDEDGHLPDNPDAEIVVTVDGRAFRERDLPAGDHLKVASHIEMALLP